MTDHDKQAGQSGRMMHWGMMACCAVMLLPIVGYFLGGGTLSGLASNTAAFAPLLLCVGAHLVMHKMMGKSCHGHGKTESVKADAPEHKSERA